MAIIVSMAMIKSLPSYSSEKSSIFTTRKQGFLMGQFLTIQNLVKTIKKLKSFPGRIIQVSVHLKLKSPGEHIRQRGDMTSSNAPVFGLGNDMGHFCPPFYQDLQHFYIIFKDPKKQPKSRNYDVVYQTLCRVYRGVMAQGGKLRLLRHLNQGLQRIRGNNLLVRIIIPKRLS